MKIVGIVGFRGYSGAELELILRRHPGVKAFLMEHRADAEDQARPRGHAGPARIACTPQAATENKLAVVFLATPPEVSMDLTPGLLEAGVKVIDLSGAYRLRTAENYKHWYKADHLQAELLDEAAYGLPEFNRAQTIGARLVSNPGCYPTAANLALRPLMQAGVFDRKAGVICDAKSGVSGAGRKPSLKTSFCEVSENFSAYSLLDHRHVPEVLQNSGLNENEFSFVAQLLPLDRGILETIYFRATGIASGNDLIKIYEQHYATNPLCACTITAKCRTWRGDPDEFLRYRCAFRRSYRTQRRGQRHRQSGEGRCRPGDAEYESGAGLSGNRGAAVKILLKLGGTLLDQPESRARLCAEIGELSQGANRVVVVHGGGKQMTRFLAERGIESRFVNGLRVTTPDVVDALLKVFAGSVNHELVAAFVGAGARPIGLSGIDDALMEAERLSEELGAVGRPVRSRPEILDLLTANGFLPVVACVAGDRQGNVYNVNGDQMAVACASGFRADNLVFLTDVEGVRGADGSTISMLDIAECGG